jgi:hypothetical protein
MSIANAVAAIGLLNDAAAAYLNFSKVVTGVVAQAQAQGRDVTEAELDQLRADRMKVIGDLNEEISRRQNKEGP